MTSAGAEKLLGLALASSAGVHGALVPAHSAELPVADVSYARLAALTR